MGQAKQRGTTQERIVAAQARLDALRPVAITCNKCNHEIKDVVDLNARGMAGVEAAFAAVCPKCGRSTYAIKGSSEAAARLMMAMEESMGQPVLIGAQ